MADPLSEGLARYGLAVGMKGDHVELRSSDMSCEYSARSWVPAAFPLVPERLIFVRLLEPGRGEIKIGAATFPVAAAGNGMAID